MSALGLTYRSRALEKHEDILQFIVTTVFLASTGNSLRQCLKEYRVTIFFSFFFHFAYISVNASTKILLVFIELKNSK